MSKTITSMVSVRCTPDERRRFNVLAESNGVAQQAMAHACLFDLPARSIAARHLLVMADKMFRNEHGCCKYCRTFAPTGEDQPWPHAVHCVLSQTTGYVPGEIVSLHRLLPT